MKKPRWKGAYHPLKWVIWSLAVLFYFYEYFIRVTPSIIVPDLMHAFHINAGKVGLLSSFYLYAYAVMQVPVGSLADKFGARRLLTIGCLICAVGGFLFGITPHIGVAEIGRFLMGLGSAFGFISVLYVSTHWFPQKRWALLVGIGNSLGMLGAVFGEGPLSYAINEWGWRFVVIALAVVAFLLGVIVYLVVRNEPKEVKKSEDFKRVTLWKSLKVVSKNPSTWVISIASGCYYASLLAFGALWGIPFFKAVYGFSTTLASFATSMIYVGFVVGGPIIGYFSDHLRHRKPLLLLFTLLTFCAMTPILYIPKLPVFMIFFLVFLSGVFASGQLLTYTFCIEANPIEVKATSVGFVNAIVFFVGSIMQYVIGAFIDLFAGNQVGHGVPVYSAKDFMFALSWFPLLLIIAFLLLLFIKEAKTHVKGNI